MFKIFGLLTTLISTTGVTTLVLLGRKFTVATSAIVAYLAATTLMVICLKGLATSALTNLQIPERLYTPLSWVIPSNFISITSLIITALACRGAYDFATKKIELVSAAN